MNGGQQDHNNNNRIVLISRGHGLVSHRDEYGLMRLTMLLLMMKSTRTMYYNNYYGSKSNYIILQNCI